MSPLRLPRSKIVNKSINNRWCDRFYQIKCIGLHRIPAVSTCDFINVLENVTSLTQNVLN